MLHTSQGARKEGIGYFAKLATRNSAKDAYMYFAIDIFYVRKYRHRFTEPSYDQIKLVVK